MENQPKDTELDEIEGLGEDEDSSWSDYPIDTLLIRHENRTIHDVLRRINMGSFIMDPEFQRDFIWSDDKQSKLIESVLMRIPLPVFYLAEDKNGRLIVVDGLQRLSTFQRFVDNKLPLKLPDHTQLNRKRFEDLSPKLQNRVEDCNLILYIIDPKVPERARLDTFERVNSAVPLTRQQMRNSLHMGPATRFLKEEASTDIFLKATGRSLTKSTMRDREFVNRFCAFQHLSPENYRGDMDEFLAQCLREMNELDSGELQTLSKQFRTSLSNNYMVFGKHAFRKSTAPYNRSVINASLWDVMSTGLSKYSEPLVESRIDELKRAFIRQMDDEEFFNAISYGTSSTKKVRYRFEAIKAALQEVFDA